MNAIEFVREGKYVGVRDLRLNLAKILNNPFSYFVTDHGKPLKVLIPYKTVLDMLEALEELKDRALVYQVAEGRAEYGKGGWVSARRRKKSMAR